MRVPVLIRMYKGNLEIYGDGENFELDIKHNNHEKTIKYCKDDDIFKPVLVVRRGDIILIKDLMFPYIFHELDKDRWQVLNTTKNKVLKNKRKYLFAVTSEAAKRGLFHNIQKNETRAI